MRQEAAAAGITRRAGRRAFPARHPALALLACGGLVLVALGAALDVGHHAGLPGFTAEALGNAGHLVTLAGMALTTAAVALAAAVRRR
jgi:hypothetical protein